MNLEIKGVNEMEEKKTNYRFSWIANFVCSIVMFAYFVIFLVTIIEMGMMSNRLEALLILLLILFFGCGIVSIISGTLALKNSKAAFPMNIATLIIIYSIIIVFSVFMGLYGALLGGWFVFFLFANSIISFILVYELNKNKKTVKEDTAKDGYDELNKKIAKLNNLKENGIIDEAQFEELKKSYISKFLLNETKD